MSFKSKFVVAGKEYNILDVSYDLSQEVDATGRPSSVTRGGKIKVTVEGTGDTMLIEWMCDNFQRKDGSIQYFKRDTDAKLKELKFTEAYMVDYNESFSSVGTNPLVETFTISARKIDMGATSFENAWV